MRRTNCAILDCSTLQCENIRLQDSTEFDRIGTITILGLTEFPVPFGIVEVDDIDLGIVQEEFDCLVFQP